ncbi:potassium channel family protein [Alkalicoccus urumqiensis]|uniref:Metal transporter n=1 Tax=Alkalicoccus urumqiensis TaxID=1548213 RepID=A0A2P6ML54_ALKUR|nr:potassium channel family protein [Alkalicoccus urumqiensis]PRO67016.1 metal transporter [Alkalicoccus urumqiensis]
MLHLILTGAGVAVIAANLIYYIRYKRFRESSLHTGLFLHMFFLLTAVTFGFALLYWGMSLGGPVLKVNDPTDIIVNVSFMEALYFSGVTMLSVGYGDFVPVGAVRFFALIQAGLGLLIPSAFFLTALGQKQQENEE